MTRIFVDQISPRINYTFDFIFESRGYAYELTENPADEVDFTYSSRKMDAIPSMKMAACMLDEHLSRIAVEVTSYSSELECLSFEGCSDPIASIFYMLSRYEEYVCQKTDEYRRFPLSESIIPAPWLTRVMCDRWAEEVLKLVGIEPIQQHQVTLIPTFDIDNSYAYKLKSGARKRFSILKDVVRMDVARIKERNSVLTGKESDPYDTFDKIKSIAKQFPATTIFWLIGDWGKKDRNISIHHPEHRELIKSMADEGINIGLHPSFGSFQKKAILQKEKKQIESVIEESISLSRQHFLRFQVASTFRDLEELGFTNEYSMGFAEHVGFRSGTARPHRWFDLEKNAVSSLTIHPFAYMDGTLREYMKLSIDESKEQIQTLYNEVLRFGGDFIFIWHNETIGDYGNWNGWSDVLDFTLSLGNESN